LGGLALRFEDFIKKGQVRKALPDKALARSLINTGKNDLSFLESVKIEERSARKVMANYYDVLRSLLEAMTALDGFKVYSHEAFTFYLKEKGEAVFAVQFDRFCKVRNKINYYGKTISVEEVIDHKEQIKKMVKILQTKYLNK
jgi:hypothetical protein